VHGMPAASLLSPQLFPFRYERDAFTRLQHQLLTLGTLPVRETAAAWSTMRIPKSHSSSSRSLLTRILWGIRQGQQTNVESDQPLCIRRLRCLRKPVPHLISSTSANGYAGTVGSIGSPATTAAGVNLPICKVGEPAVAADLRIRGDLGHGTPLSVSAMLAKPTLFF
jgi:hypothetical protein